MSSSLEEKLSKIEVYGLSTLGQSRRRASLFESAEHHIHIRVAHVVANHKDPMPYT